MCRRLVSHDARFAPPFRFAFKFKAMGGTFESSKKRKSFSAAMYLLIYNSDS